MPPWPEKFRAAFEKGVRDIKGKLCPLNISEKRQLLAILRKLDDCPDGWKNTDPKKQYSILQCLYQAIGKLLDPEKRKAADARHQARNRENGKQKAANAKSNAINNAKRAKATREANRQAILENQDHHEAIWDEDTIEKEATENVEYIVKRCGRNGFVHVFVGAWPGKDLNKAVEAECFGKGRHAVFIDGGRRVHYHHVSDHVKLLIPYTGINCENADELEKRVQTKLIDMGWPQDRRMFVRKGSGSCKGKRDAGMPFPYYTCVLVCEQSMEQIGIRLTTKKDRASRKRKRQ